MMRLTAKTFHGLEDVLAEEVKSLGGKNVLVNRRVVTFDGDLKTLYRCNYESRLAINFLLPIHRFQARTDDELYEGVKQIRWEEHLDPKKSFMIQFTVRSDHFKHSQYAALKTKDAIADYFRDKYGERPSVSKERADLIIDLNIRDNKVILSLNSTGQPLFKRGYRHVMGEAPINEILAAGLIALSEWDKKSEFLDPMCGSGTIPIEAAMAAANVPPGVLRKFYSLIRWNNFDQRIWDEVKDSAVDRITDRIPRIAGSDAHFGMVKKARINQTNLEDYFRLSFQNFNIKELIAPDPGSTIIMNPPYGERMSQMEGIKNYEALGDIMKKQFKGSTVWIITSDREDIKHIGLKTSKRINLKNGPLDCTFRRYDLY